MKIVLLGKCIEDYPPTDWQENKLIYTSFGEGNKEVFRYRLAENFDKEVRDRFVMNGNGFKTTTEIIAAVRVIISSGILTDEQWQRAIPIIERGLEANKAYVRMLDEMAPIFKHYCSEYGDVGMHHTFRERIGLELWQGKFHNGHWCNPNRKPEYS